MTRDRACRWAAAEEAVGYTYRERDRLYAIISSLYHANLRCSPSMWEKARDGGLMTLGSYPLCFFRHALLAQVDASREHGVLVFLPLGSFRMCGAFNRPPTSLGQDVGYGDLVFTS